jgi:hypothetical protein
MRNKLLICILGLVSLILIGCTTYEEPIDNDGPIYKVDISNSINNTSDLLGVWVNILNHTDTIIFFEGRIRRWDKLANGFFNFYNYRVFSDSIFLKYTGAYKVGTPPYTRKILINEFKDSILIKDFHSVYPGIKGDIFAKKL